MNHTTTENTINEVHEIYVQIRYYKDLVLRNERKVMKNECDDLPTYSQVQITQYIQNIEVYSERILELEKEIVELIKGIEV